MSQIDYSRTSSSTSGFSHCLPQLLVLPTILASSPTLCFGSASVLSQLFAPRPDLLLWGVTLTTSHDGHPALVLPCFAVINLIVFDNSLLIIILMKISLFFRFIPSLFFRMQIKHLWYAYFLSKRICNYGDIFSFGCSGHLIIVPFFPPRVSSDEILVLFISVEINTIAITLHLCLS